MPDACVPAVQAFAARHEADAGPLLGFVMAHELGHLLLGPGHAGDGVMRKGVGAQKTEALRQRWLKFNVTDADRIRRELLARKTAPASGR